MRKCDLPHSFPPPGVESGVARLGAPGARYDVPDV